jgi:signal transduction histidine kinase
MVDHADARGRAEDEARLAREDARRASEEARSALERARAMQVEDAGRRERMRRLLGRFEQQLTRAADRPDAPAAASRLLRAIEALRAGL